AFFPVLKGITGVLPQASYWLCWQDESLLFFPALKGITTFCGSGLKYRHLRSKTQSSLLMRIKIKREV
ncbi:MAG: hypothetical protein ACPL7A_03600, partial [Anaerolineales bacterium]